jgi:DNA-binding NtrC family response regulator
MAGKGEKFKILVCGKRQLVDQMRKIVGKSDDIHIQYTETVNFLLGRAMFDPPRAVVINGSWDRDTVTEVLGTLHAQYHDLAIQIIGSAFRSQEVVEFMKLGADGCYVIPEDYRKLSDRLNQLLEEWRLIKSRSGFSQLQRRSFNFDQILGKSHLLRETLHRAKKVIENTSMTVLITGETGTGKELFARAIHYNSAACDNPFVDIACSALPEHLLESELFGFEKGAFTDAREKKPGLFELAGEGTIFLDEIGDISPAIQSKLLKVIESRTMRRLGGLQDIPVKARIIAATSADLDFKTKSGEFRKDLFHRLKILPLEVPPLRERKEDIPMLMESFIILFNKLYKKGIRGVTPEGYSFLMEYDWEGNIRELKHCAERAVLLGESEYLDAADFRFLVPHADAPENASPPPDAKSADPAPPGRMLTLTMPLEESTIDEVQRRLAVMVLEQVRGNKSKAAYILRISRPRLDRILRSSRENEAS